MIKLKERLGYGNSIGKYKLFVLSFLLSIFLLGFVLAVSWIGNDINYQGFENTLYTHNLSANISSPEPGMRFDVDTLSTNLTWNGVKVDYSNISSWMYIEDSNTGIFIINATTDNQTGFFRIPFKVTSGETIAGVYFNFTVNATNDAPNFTLNINYTASLVSSNVSYNISLIGSDEEKQYPLSYNISFGGCELASWSSRIATNNCNLSYTITNISNITSVLNFTSLTNDDVGIYNLTVCVHDNVYGVALPLYNDASYTNNKTVCKNTTFILEKALAIAVSNCNNQILQENQSFACQVNVTSKGISDSLNVWTNATLRNTGLAASNSSWFFSFNNSNSSSFMQSYYVNVTPQKREIGNWTINFTAMDLSTGENRTETFYIYVNRTLNALPSLGNLNNIVTSINASNEVYFNASDNDLLIPDKDVYNESISFSWNITNLSNLNQQLSITGFSIVSSGSGLGVINNVTRAKLIFTGSSSEAGNYSVNITSRDKDGVNNSAVFNITILSNNFPVWYGNASFNISVNSTFATTSSFYGNMTNISWFVYASDPDGNQLTFTNSSGAMPSFNLSSNGIISFKPYKQDVGFWNFSVTVRDSYLSTINYFVFNVSNINSAPNITNLNAWNASYSNSGKNVSAIEDNATTIFLSVYDDDSLINKSIYNETFNIFTSILNLTSGNINFNFSFYETYPEAPSENQTTYFARFTPNKTNVGEYNVTLNVTDLSGNSTTYTFRLIISALQHNPTPTNVLNQTASITRVFSYNFSANDIEDGNSSKAGNYNFTFAINDSMGKLNFNSTNFNSTTGNLNILFNSSQAGKHLIYLNVSDSTWLNSSTSFWINIYDYPNITLPILNSTFNVQENFTSNITFAINHSVGDALNYSFYINSILLNNSYNICNSSNRTFYFTPNFTQESYGDYSNMSLFVFNPLYPELNYTQLFYFNITHTNYPVNNYNIIPNQSSSLSAIILNLKDYFSDVDADDNKLNQTIRFDYNLVNLTSGTIPSVSYNDWINGSLPNVTFSSSNFVGIYSITAKEYNESNSSQIIRNVTSNNFSVSFSVTSVVTPTPSSGGGGSSQPKSIKIIASSEFIVEKNGYFEFPFQIRNTGSGSLQNIDLSNVFSRELGSDISTRLSKNNIASLSSGESENLILYINVNTQKIGKYLITLFANVSSPKISDWADISLNIINSKEGEAKKIIVFTEKLLVDNAECLELNELLKEAQKLFDAGDYVGSLARSQEAIDGCKKSISMNSQIKQVKNVYSDYSYYFIFTFSALAIFLIYVLVRRARFKNKFPHYSS